MHANTIQKYSKQSIPTLLKKAEKVFNEYIRLRDQNKGCFTCISCGQIKLIDKMHAGHYMAAGHYAAVRFSEDNVHGQCEHCNTFLHGNLIQYRANLIRKIGEHKVQVLEAHSRSVYKWERCSLIQSIEIYSAKIKALKMC